MNREAEILAAVSRARAAFEQAERLLVEARQQFNRAEAMLATPEPESGFGASFRDVLTPPEAAELMGVSEQTIRNLVNDGLLPHCRLKNKLIRIRKTDVERYLAGAAS